MKSFLRDRDWIEDSSPKFKLQNIKELLYAWAKDYHKKNTRSYEFYSLGVVWEPELEIAEWSASHDTLVTSLVQTVIDLRGNAERGENRAAMRSITSLTFFKCRKWDYTITLNRTIPLWHYCYFVGNAAHRKAFSCPHAYFA